MALLKGRAFAYLAAMCGLRFWVMVIVLSCIGASTRGATNLLAWPALSNAWHAVPTNELVDYAIKGNGEAQCYLGMMFMQGWKGFPTNQPLAREWLRKGADQEVAHAQNMLGTMLVNGIGGATNVEQGMALIRASAQLGFSRAEATLGRYYQRGVGVPTDPVKALEWYQKSANHGFSLAKSELGLLLSQKKYPTGQDRVDALRWLGEAADEGEAPAQYRLGWMYWKGEGVGEDAIEARRLLFAASRQGSEGAMNDLFKLANRAQDHATMSNLFPLVVACAERGSARAQYNAGTMISSGLGTLPDRAKGVTWYEKAAAQEYAPALTSVAGYYDSTGPNQDRKKAYQYYERAAAKGSAYARTRASELLLSGDAGVKDEEKGIAGLREGALAGNAGAQYNMATRYREGRGVPTNISEAIQWYSRAASRDEVRDTAQIWAMMHLGILYAKGEGVPRDDAEAFRWFTRQAEYGWADAEDSLGYLHALGRGVKQDDVKAVEYFREAGHNGHPTNSHVFYGGVANLGVMYALGRGGLEKDEQRAVALFQLAITNGRALVCPFPQAHTALAICLYDGRGTTQNMARAFTLFRQAAEWGHPQAQLHAGVLCWRGEGTERNLTNAFAYLEAAALKNEPGAAEWRALAEGKLDAAQRAQAAARGRVFAAGDPECHDQSGRKRWNFGLRLPNLAITERPR